METRRIETVLPRWTSVFNFDRDSSSFLVVPLLILVVSLLIASSLLDLVVWLSLNAVVLVILRRLSRCCSSGFSKKKRGLESKLGRVLVTSAGSLDSLPFSEQE